LIPNPTFHFNADPDLATHQSNANLRPMEGDMFNCPRPFHFEHLKLLKFDCNADPDPGFHSYADPDPGFHSSTDLDLDFHSNADPDPAP
jgi:hypothetical protein